MNGQGRAAAALAAPAAAWVAAAIALTELVRHWNDGAGAVDAAAHPAAMVPAAAVGALAAAAALMLVCRPRGATALRVGRLLALAVMVLGLAVLGQYLIEWGSIADSGMLMSFDGWAARRPGPVTGLGLTALGVSLFALGAGRRNARRLAGPGAAVALAIAFMGLVGHAYGASVLYGLNRWGGTAVPTAVALGTLAIGVLCVDPSRGVFAVAQSDSAGGHLLRRLMPAALFAPLLLGWIALRTYEGGFANAAFAAALTVVSLAVLLVGLTVRQGHGAARG